MCYPLTTNFNTIYICIILFKQQKKSPALESADSYNEQTSLKWSLKGP